MKYDSVKNSQFLDSPQKMCFTETTVSFRTLQKTEVQGFHPNFRGQTINIETWKSSGFQPS